MERVRSGEDFEERKRSTTDQDGSLGKDEDTGKRREATGEPEAGRLFGEMSPVSLPDFNLRGGRVG